MALLKNRAQNWTKYIRHLIQCTNISKAAYSSDKNAALSSKIVGASKIPGSSKRNKILYTPGPLMVSDRVLGAMRTDIGSRHSDFEYLITFIRNSLVQLAGVNTNTHTAIPMAGSGTLAIESTLSTALSGKKGTVLVLENGMYGQKIANICKRYGNNVETVRVHTEALEQRLQQSDDVIGVVSVHYETTSGILNPVFEIGKIIKQKKKDCIFIVDAISSFGGIPYDATNIDYAVSSACKCLQGVPGVSFVIANISEIEKQIGMNKILTLDLAGQYQELERTRQFRFTPPTHVLLALKEALLELEDEGGVEKRMKRFKENASILNHGMQKLGFKHSADNDQKTHIVTSFQYPENPRFVYGDFMDRLDRRGLQLCAERTNTKGHFRVGTIGNLYPEDMKLLVDGIEDVCAEMDIKLPLS